MEYAQFYSHFSVGKMVLVSGIQSDVRILAMSVQFINYNTGNTRSSNF